MEGNILPPVNQTELESLICFFQHTLLLEDLSPDMLSRLAKSAQRRCYEPHDVICRRNDYAECFYFVEEGQIAEFSVDRKDFKAIAWLHGPEGWFGTLDALLGDAYTTTAIAVQRSNLIVLPSDLFRRAMETPSCRRAMLMNLRQKLISPQDERCAHLGMNAEERLAYALLLLQTGSLGMRYVRITQEELAVTCSIARQTASRILSDWKLQKVIDTFRGKITIRDPRALAAVLVNSVLEKEGE